MLPAVLIIIRLQFLLEALTLIVIWIFCCFL